MLIIIIVNWNIQTIKHRKRAQKKDIKELKCPKIKQGKFICIVRGLVTDRNDQVIILNEIIVNHFCLCTPENMT